MKYTATGKLSHIAVEHVAGEHHEAAPLLDRKGDQIVERLARSRLNPPGKVRRLERETDERAVQMQIGRMYEPKTPHVSRPPRDNPAANRCGHQENLVLL